MIVEWGERVKSDSEIREDVINELQWDPQITDPDAIGVAVADGAVTLTGTVPSRRPGGGAGLRGHGRGQ